MKVSFINPSITGEPTRGTFEPPTFAALEAVTQPDIERALHDECLTPIPCKQLKLDERTGIIFVIFYR